ncbi:MAG: hypothetical protein V4456_23875 [Bacteroidota bacterium]
MKFLVKIILNFIIITNLSNSFAQTISKKDTIYYFIDTAKIPVLDRMIRVDIANPHKFYTINCPCLSSGSNPVFRTNINNTTPVNKSKVAKIKFISLAKLIELVRKNDTPYFNDAVTIFFIEAREKIFIQERVFFLGGKQTKME